MKTVLLDWLCALPVEERWTHCGADRQHDRHEHTLSIVDGSSFAVTCVGTPDLTEARK